MSFNHWWPNASVDTLSSKIQRLLSYISWVFVPSCWYQIPGCWCIWMYSRIQHSSFFWPQVHACTTRCSSRLFSLHRLPHSKEHPFWIVYHILLIHQTIHLESKSYNLCNTVRVVFVLENGSWSFLSKLKMDKSEENLFLLTFCS